jgi:hypothetical protein
MDKFEKLVQEIMRDAEKDNEPLTRQDAEEIAKMELKAKKIKRYEGNKAGKKQEKPKIVKVSDEKQELFNKILTFLQENYENVDIINKNKLISVKIDNKNFKIDLIQQRKG